jgi:hypothetical protein
MDNVPSQTNNLERRKLLFSSRVVRNVGITLFLLSFLAPPHWKFGDEFTFGGGCMAFIETPYWALIAATKAIQDQTGNWQLCFLSLTMLIGWTANFTIFFRLSFVVAMIAIASPWILYLGNIFLGNTIGISTTAIKFVPFYPWAFGIGLIHLSKLASPKPKEEPRTMWTGF